MLTCHVSESEDAAPLSLHQGLSTSSHGDERVSTDIECSVEARPRGLQEGILQFAGGSKGDTMDQAIEFSAEDLTSSGECSIELAVVLDIARNNLCARNFLGQIAYIFLHAILIGQNDPSTFAFNSLGTCQGNRTMVRNPTHNSVFAFSQ